MGDLNSSPRTWVAGEFVTQTMLNDELRIPLTLLQSAWTPWTPTLSSDTTAPSLGNSTLTGLYHRVGKSIMWRLRLVIGSTFAAGAGSYFMSLPASIGGVMATEDVVAVGSITTGGVRRPITACVQAAGTCYMLRNSTETLIGSGGPGVAWAAGHQLSLMGVHPIA